MHEKCYTIGEKLIGGCYRKYIRWAARTSELQIEGDIDQKTLRNAMIGFGHGDSLGVQFLLQMLQNEKNHIQVIITADKRGNYIEYVANAYGAHALRMPDGAKIRQFLEELKQVARSSTTLCIALDGPLGPYHEPKKLGFMLAHEGNKEMILIQVECTHKLHLFKRWDQYVVPLPFWKITFRLQSAGKVTIEDLRSFTLYKQKIKDKLGW